MPYIKQEDRVWLEGPLHRLEHQMGIMDDKGPGPLNYIITNLLIEWLGDNPNYERYNAAIGVLECAKLELYRRQIAPYEDTKIKANGDVYGATEEEDESF